MLEAVMALADSLMSYILFFYLPVRIATFGGCVIKMHLLPESTDRQNVFH